MSQPQNPLYTLSMQDGKPQFLKDGHTMFAEDVVKSLNRGAALEAERAAMHAIAAIAVPSPVSYVVGFLFSPCLTRVALITKNRPAWQAGLLNGIGGKVEPGENPLAAMVREFNEEAGLLLQDWSHFASMSEQGRFALDMFAAIGDVDAVTSKTDEPVAVLTVTEALQRETVENIPWLLLLAVDHLQDGRPGFVNINYPRV